MKNDGTFASFPGNSASFTFKQKITGLTGDGGITVVQIMVPLYYLSNFWRTLEMPLINCKINLILTWFANCVIFNAAAIQGTKFPITNTKLYAPVVNKSNQDNTIMQIYCNN